jgi:heme exporter protein D
VQIINEYKTEQIIKIIILVTCAEYLFRVGYLFYPFIIITLTVISMIINIANHKKRKILTSVNKEDFERAGINEHYQNIK